MWWKKIETHITSSEKKIAGKKPGAIYGIGGHAESCYLAFKCDVLRVFENCTHYNAKFAFYVEYARRQRVKFESRVRLQTSFFLLFVSLFLSVFRSVSFYHFLSPPSLSCSLALSRSLSLSLGISFYTTQRSRPFIRITTTPSSSLLHLVFPLLLLLRLLSSAAASSLSSSSSSSSSSPPLYSPTRSKETWMRSTTQLLLRLQVRTRWRRRKNRVVPSRWKEDRSKQLQQLLL